MKNFLYIFLLAAATVLAQTGSDSLKLKLAPITVTATRYAENVHEIPYAISIINYRDFLTVKPFGFDDAISSVPGVLAQSRSGSQDVRITIRGFGARGAGDRSNSGTSRGIRVMVDGIPETEPDGRTSFDMVESGFAEKIEVIRSNASALWGNASGGVINVSTMPDFTDDFFMLSGTYGGFGSTKILGKGGFGFQAGKLVYGIANNHMDGWRKHSESHRTMAALSFQGNLSERSTLGVHILASRSKFLIPGPLSLSQYNANAQQANVEYQSRDERRFNRIGRIGVTFEHHINDMHGISLMTFVSPKFLQRSERKTFRDFNRYHVGGSIMYHNSVTFANGIRNKFVAGLDEAYQDGSIQFYGLTSSNERDTILQDNKREGTNTFGAFAQNEINFENLSVLLGLRYDRVTYYSEKLAINNNKFNLTSAGQDKAFSNLTPKIGVTYVASDYINVYANVGGGVEVPAGNETDDISAANAINPLLEPITSKTYEVGVKSLPMPIGGAVSSLSFDAAMYYISVNNDIIPFQEGKYYLTIGESTRLGFELQAAANTNFGLQVSNVLTLSDNTYDTYTLTKAYAGKDTSYNGNDMAGLPAFANTLSINYKPDFFRQISFGLQLKSVGKYFADDANTLTVPEYSVVNFSVAYERVLEFLNNIGIRASLSINNVLDTKYVSSAFINPIKYSVSNSSVKEIGYIEPGLPRYGVFTLTVML